MTTSAKKRVSKVAMGVAAAGVATSVAGVAATQPASISASLVDLAALIVVGSSTNPTGAGVENFFQGKFNDPIYTGPSGDDIVHVNFLTGPFGIQQALEANANEPNVVIASGWGAANASLLLLGNNPDLSQTVFILDNDVSRPDGGFGTRYPWFALIGVNPIPTPSDTDALAVVNIGYEYDYNSNAPADVLNPVAAVNSLVAYLYRHLDQEQLDLPVKADGTPDVTCNANTCAITQSGDVLDCQDARCSSPEDRITAYVTTRGNTTYVTYTSDGLPLARLIRDVVPFGDLIADATEPLLKVIVDSAYYDGNPIPKDPSAYRPARPFPSPTELIATASKIPGAVEEGLAAATSSDSSATSTTESSAPSDEVTKPLTDVVRESDKAEPGTVGLDDDATTDPEPVDTPDNSAVEDPAESAQTDVDDAGTQESDESDDESDHESDQSDESGDDDAAAAA
ncbi:MAG TPA: PE-PPE domain-containing protein [Mycobacterium sp.]|nr:PE-PPE domain-containing protein [Mycobacterium sp.]